MKLVSTTKPYITYYTNYSKQKARHYNLLAKFSGCKISDLENSSIVSHMPNDLSGIQVEQFTFSPTTKVCNVTFSRLETDKEFEQRKLKNEKIKERVRKEREEYKKRELLFKEDEKIKTEEAEIRRLILKFGKQLENKTVELKDKKKK